MIKERSFNQDSYIEFLRQLRSQQPEQRIVLFLDNLSVHKTKKVKELYEELELTPIFNAPYSPKYNGIESYWFFSNRSTRSSSSKAWLRRRICVSSI